MSCTILHASAASREGERRPLPESGRLHSAKGIVPCGTLLWYHSGAILTSCDDDVVKLPADNLLRLHVPTCVLLPYTT